MITQIAAENLMQMPKKWKSSGEIFSFPAQGEFAELDFISLDEKVKFIIDVNRKGTIRLKCTYQERYRSSIILVRLDIMGSPHTNPPDSLAPLIS